MFFGQCLSCVAFFLMGTGSEALCMYTYVSMGWLRLVGLIKSQVTFAEYRLVYRALLQKRPINLWSYQPKPPHMYIYVSHVYVHGRIYVFIYLYMYISICVYIYMYFCTSYINIMVHGGVCQDERFKPILFCVHMCVCSADSIRM